MISLLDYIVGFVLIKINGSGVERFLNLAIQRGIRVWDVSRLADGSVMAKVELSSIRPLRHVARISRCRFRIRGRGGLPFRIKMIKKRKLFTAGAVFFVLALYLLSSFAFFIHVESPRPLKIVNASLVERLAAEKGVRPYRLKALMDYKEAERYLMKEIPQLAWVNIQSRGTLLEIQVVEKTLPEPAEKNKKPGHVLAAKDGLVTEILVLKGQAAVAPGDTVARDDILISGIIPPPPPPTVEGTSTEAEQATPEEKVRADGIVRARVWYRGYGECPLVETGKKNTGKLKTAITIGWQGKTLRIIGPDKSPYPYALKEEGRGLLTIWRNITLPVEIIRTTYREQSVYRREWGRSGAIQEATKIALAAARRGLPPGAKVTSREARTLNSEDPNLARVSVILETEEDIGKFLPIE